MSLDRQKQRQSSTTNNTNDIVGGWDAVMADIPDSSTDASGGGSFEKPTSSSGAAGPVESQLPASATPRRRLLSPWEQMVASTDDDDESRGSAAAVVESSPGDDVRIRPGNANERTASASTVETQQQLTMTEEDASANNVSDAVVASTHNDETMHQHSIPADRSLLSTLLADSTLSSDLSVAQERPRKRDQRLLDHADDFADLAADPTLSDLLGDGSIKVDTSSSDDCPQESNQVTTDVSEGRPEVTVDSKSKFNEEAASPVSSRDATSPHMYISAPPQSSQPHFFADSGAYDAASSQQQQPSESQGRTQYHPSAMMSGGNNSMDYSAMEDDEPQRGEEGDLNSKRPRRLNLPESLMARTRSRADVDSPMMSATGPAQEAAHMIQVLQDEEARMYNSRVAKRRVRVVQLLVFGLIGLVLGFFGSLFVQGSCHFATARLGVGQDGQPFDSHFGLWKYTPMDSVFQGYTYCLNYSPYSDEAPQASRVAGILALVTGTYSMAVLWAYLISGRASHNFWKWAVRLAAASGVFQALTLTFFVTGICLSDTCAIGPAAIVSCLSAAAWFVLAYELHYNRPITEHIPDVQPISTDDSLFVHNLEMADFHQGADDYLKRINGGNNAAFVYRQAEELPSLNHAQRHNEQPLGQMCQVRSPVISEVSTFHSPRRSGTYRSPPPSKKSGSGYNSSLHG